MLQIIVYAHLGIATNLWTILFLQVFVKLHIAHAMAGVGYQLRHMV